MKNQAPAVTLSQDQLKTLVGVAALAYVVPGEIIGVGTGSTVNKFIDALAGMRDEGLSNLAMEVTMLPALAQLQQALAAPADAESAFEALYEVLGFSKTNFDANLVYSATLNTEVLWQNQLLGN